MEYYGDSLSLLGFFKKDCNLFTGGFKEKLRTLFEDKRMVRTLEG